MSIHRDDVIYADPTNKRDVLSATPSNGASYGTISVTHGTYFNNGFYDNHGRTQSVCVKPGEELAVLAALGDQLRGIRPDEPDNRTIVGTVAALKELAASLGLDVGQTQSLISRFALAPARDDDQLV